MIELPKESMVKVLQNLDVKDVMKFFICSKEEDVKQEYLLATKEYLLTTKDRDWDKKDKAILFFQLAKPENIKPKKIVEIVNGFTLQNGASKVQVLQVLASNKELFKTLSLEHKKEIADFVIFPMGMSPQEEKNNESEVERNQQKMAEILGIDIIIKISKVRDAIAVAVDYRPDQGCVIS